MGDVFLFLDRRIRVRVSQYLDGLSVSSVYSALELFDAIGLNGVARESESEIVSGAA